MNTDENYEKTVSKTENLFRMDKERELSIPREIYVFKNIGYRIAKQPRVWFRGSSHIKNNRDYGRYGSKIQIANSVQSSNR